MLFYHHEDWSISIYLYRSIYHLFLLIYLSSTYLCLFDYVIICVVLTLQWWRFSSNIRWPCQPIHIQALVWKLQVQGTCWPVGFSVRWAGSKYWTLEQSFFPPEASSNLMSRGQKPTCCSASPQGRLGTHCSVQWCPWNSFQSSSPPSSPQCLLC